MCGIIGISSPDLVDEAKLRTSVMWMRHRGPDGEGFTLHADGKVGLGHSRLSIIDLSKSGAQPMTNEDGNVCVTFNGEIYNYKALKKDLISKGHDFKSLSDTEVLVHGYEEWGTKLFEKLEGMFAIGVWDGRRKKIILGRDRFGIKPLYYYYDGKTFIFGSELKSFYPFKEFQKDLDLSSVIDYLHYYVIPAPKTIWKNTYKLLPGYCLVYSPDRNEIIKNNYWSINPESNKVRDGEAIERTHFLIDQSVHRHLESDVPVGVFLSSGYDSSALVSYTKKFTADIDTFSIGFQGSSKTEHKEAATIAQHFGTTHHEMVLDEDYMGVLPDLSSFYDEPFGVTSMVSYYYVSRLARQKNKVVFAGDGGDEVFGGYTWYDTIQKQFRQRGLLQRIRHLQAANLKAFYQSSYFSFMGTSIPWVKEILSKDLNQFYPEDVYWPYSLPEEQWRLSPLKVFQLLDFKRFLPDVALPRADRSSMAASLEVRVPFLDHHLVEYLIALDESVYHKAGVKKYLLYENIKSKLPQEILSLPKKGFGNPLDPFYAGKRAIVSQMRDGRLLRSGWFNEHVSLDRLNKKQLWLLYNLELWLSKWL